MLIEYLNWRKRLLMNKIQINDAYCFISSLTSTIKSNNSPSFTNPCGWTLRLGAFYYLYSGATQPRTSILPVTAADIKAVRRSCMS